ncbi:MAG: ParB N-terminal domain-containing protein [Pseudomonadota bacterium]
MAKRKRLGPAEAFTTPQAAPETKSAVSKPPIASVAGEVAAMDAVARMAAVLESARDEGRLVQKIPLDRVVADHLIRDRMGADPTEMAALVDSLRRRGQQTPIEVVDLGGERYGLVSGWRRLHALRDLANAGGTETVLARIIAPGTEAEAYVAMVEENEIRVGLSYYERARIVLRAEEAGIYPTRKAALQGLFANVSRAKRSKIGSFITVVEALDDHLRFPTEIGERLGLQLAKALEAGQGEDLQAVLATPAPDADHEQNALRGALAAPASAPRKPAKAAPAKNAPVWGEITLRETKAGLVLKGPGVTDAFKTALEAWLAQKG